MWLVLGVNVVLSVAGYFLILNVVPKLRDMFMRAGMTGLDLGKVEKPEM
jgi:hypothetical protein